MRFVSGETNMPASQDTGGEASGGSLAGSLALAIAELETRLVREALAAAHGNQSEAARTLGVSRVGLIKKIARLGLR